MRDYGIYMRDVQGENQPMNEQRNERQTQSHTYTLLFNAFPLTFRSEAWHNVFFSCCFIEMEQCDKSLESFRCCVQVCEFEWS